MRDQAIAQRVGRAGVMAWGTASGTERMDTNQTHVAGCLNHSCIWALLSCAAKRRGSCRLWKTALVQWGGGQAC